MPKPLKILQASAGSGKTFSLTAHYLTLLFSGPNKYREILAVTFTNKATEEMKTRILEVLRGFARGDKKYDNYKTQVLSACPSLQEAELRLKADQTYRKILHDYSRFSVHTIDGFVQKVIRGFAFELGLDAGYTLEMNYDKVKTELANKLDKALDQQPQLLQWIIDLAIERINDNVSWNYRNELLNLASELFKERYQPFEQAIATLGKVTDLDSLFKDYQTLTKQKIAGFEQRIEQFGTAAQQLFEVLDPDVTALKGKSRSPLFNLKKIAGGDLSKVQGVNKLVDAPEEWFQKDTFELHGNREIFEELNPVLKELTTVFQQESAAYITAQSFNKNLYYLRLMQEMAAILKGYREENGNLLISDAQNLLKGITEDADDNPSFIWEKMGNRYKNFLFDEFQDTSANQWGSFKSLLTNAIAAPSGKLTDHLIVGDTKQSIYRWRNGDWNILHQYAKNDVGPHNVVEESLEENYRSSRNIIDFNNSLFTALSQLLQQHLNNAIEDTDNAIAGWWQNMGFDKIVTSVYANAIQKTTPATPAGGTIKYTILKTDAAGLPLNKNSFTETALEQTIEEIRYLITVKKYQPKDICILVRKNAEAVAAVKALLENNINVISGEALLIANNNGVKLILNTLRVLAGASGQTALFKANCISLYARLQGNKVTPGSLFGLNFKTLDQLGNVLPPELCTAWQTWMQQPLPELVEKIIGAYGLNTKTADLPYLFAFRDLAGRFAQQGEQGVAAFMCFWEEEGVKKTLPSTENEDAVQVITIHKSKGLAFRAVMLPFCNWPFEGKANGIFWVPAKDTPYHLLDSIPLKYNKNLGNSTIARAYFEELLFSNMDNLNTLYVATTRAKEYIYITSMGKKAESISNIGDLLASALDEKMAGESTYVIDEPVAQKEAGIQEGTPLTLTSYPIVNRLSTVFDADLKRREIELLTGKDAGRMGSILHEVLANTHQKAGLETVLEDMLNAGLFKAEELQELKAQAMTVLEHTALQQILNKSTETLTEQTIIAANGKSYRPDKVLINEDGVSIIDYKFTQEESDKHIEQVDHYKNLLVEMGYTNVKTYLFYAHTGLLKQV